MGEEVLKRSLELANKIITLAIDNGYSTKDLINACCAYLALMVIKYNKNEQVIRELIDVYKKFFDFQADKSEGGE